MRYAARRIPGRYTDGLAVGQRWTFIGIFTAGLLLMTPTRPLWSAPTTSAILKSFGALPMRFEPGEGSTNPAKQFISRGLQYQLVLSATDMRLRLPAHRHETSIHSASIRLRFLGANPRSMVHAEEMLPTKTHYFIGNSPSQWRMNIPTYARVHYESIYPGIDLVYYGTQQQLEYDVIVAPGADLRALRLAVEGAERVTLDGQGDVLLSLHGTSLRMRKPRVYQLVHGVQRSLAGRYVFLDHARHVVGFRVDTYDRSSPLIIDPILSYSTYLGGSGGDGLSDLAVDANGNVYLTGTTDSTDFPTVAPLQTATGGSFDAFIAKLTPTGSALVYATYVGGNGIDIGTDIAVDGTGNAYVTGATMSTNFPTANAFQPTFAGGAAFGDAFLIKLNADGSALLYATYIGGANDDRGLSVAIDGAGNAYVTGETDSTDFPTLNPLQATIASSFDVFAIKVNLNGPLAALDYSTYLGGNGIDRGLGIAVDSAGNAYLTGETSSTDFPTANAWQGALNGTAVDAFVTKINVSGSALVYSTYLGGSLDDHAEAIAVDAGNNATVAGQTESSNFPTVNPFQSALGGTSDAFVAQFNASGSALGYSTYLGGSGVERGMGLALDAAGSAYVTGDTTSTNFPTATPFQGANAGDVDAFITKLSVGGNALEYSSYLGGSNIDRGIGVAVDSAGIAYVGGNTISTNLPTVNPFQSVFGGAQDGFVSKVEVTPGQPLQSVGPVNVWIGLKNSDDVGIRFDLRAEAYRNATQLIGSGGLNSVAGGSSGFNNAQQQTIPLTPVPGVTFFSGDTFSIRVLVRNACSGSGKNSGRARLWYDDAEANSRAEITLQNPMTYYLRGGLILSPTIGAGPTLTLDVAAGAKCSAFKPFGTWSTTVQ